MSDRIKQYRIVIFVKKGSASYRITSDYSKPRGITYKEMLRHHVDNYEGKGYEVVKIKAKENMPPKLPPYSSIYRLKDGKYKRI